MGGDYARWYPPLLGEPPASGIFRELNRGKRGLALDLKNPAAVEALRVLIGTADVLVDSFRPGTLARLGLDPDALRAEHPRLVYCAITGFGLDGPDAARPGHDIGYQARAGGLGVGADPERPVVGPLQVADLGGALVAVSGILAALYQRERTGRGAVVDTSLTESALAFGSIYFAKHLAGEAPERGGEMLDGSRPCYTTYRTQDGGAVAVGALEPKFFAAFLQVIGLPELQNSGLDGGEAGQRVRARIQAVLETRTAAEWRTAFADVGACVEVVASIPEAREDPQLVARHAFHADGTVRTPIRVGEGDALTAPPEPLRESPALGEDTQEILRAAGVDEAVLAKL